MEVPDPKGMLDDLLNYINIEDVTSEDNYRIFLVLDTDLNDKRIKEIKIIEKKCIQNNIEIITSSPTFEIWYIMHYRNNKLKFNSSKEVKKELQNINGIYKENMDLYNIINGNINNAINTAKSIEQKIINNKEDLYSSNPHTSIYKIINAINEFNNKKY